MNRFTRILLVVCAISVMTIVSIAAARKWTDSTGKFQVDAEFVKFEDGKVFLKSADGKVLEIAIGQLSAADQKWVRDELKRQRGGEAANSEAGSSSGSGMADGEWGQWRGPKRDGVSTESGLNSDWNKEAPSIVWSVKGAGRGYSSIAVAGGRIFTMGRIGDGEKIIALSEKDGSPLWTAPVGPGGDCNCTPTVDGDLVYGLGREGDLVCARVESGEVVWKKNFGKDLGGRMMSGWGFSESPLIDGDLLICTPGGDRAVVAALNKKTGETVWMTPMQGGGGAGYASLVVSHGGGVKQYITLLGRGLISVAADDGRLLWHYQRIANGTANVPTPIVKGDFVFGSTGYGDGGSALLKLDKAGNGVKYEEVYYKKSNELQNHHGGMVLIGDYIYMGHGHNRGLPACLHMESGKIVWGPERGAGGDSAALVAADGHLYFRYQDGIMALVEATPDGYNLKGSFRIKTVNGSSWPHPVVANKKLYLRDQDDLHCYDIAAR